MANADSGCRYQSYFATTLLQKKKYRFAWKIDDSKIKAVKSCTIKKYTKKVGKDAKQPTKTQTKAELFFAVPCNLLGFIIGHTLHFLKEG